MLPRVPHKSRPGDELPVPFAIDAASASSAEFALAKSTLDAGFLPDVPACFVGDKVYDSDALARGVAEEGIELIAPNREKRKIKTQDSRPPLRYKRYWNIERLFARLQNFRRILTWHVGNVLSYLAFVQLGCVLILLRRYL